MRSPDYLFEYPTALCALAEYQGSTQIVEHSDHIAFRAGHAHSMKTIDFDPDKMDFKAVLGVPVQR